MKKILGTLSLLALSSLLAGEEIRTEVAATVGYHKFDGASILKDSALFGVRATMYETEVNKFGLQFGYEGNSGIAYEGTILDTNLHRFYTHLIVDGEEEYGITPYILVGGGYEYLSDEIQGEPSQGFADLGLGFKYYFTPHIHMSLEGRALGKFDTRDLDFHANVALGYDFTGKEVSTTTPLSVFDTDEKVSEAKEELKPHNTTVNVVEIPTVKPQSIIMPIEEAEVVLEKEPQTSIIASGFYVQMAAYSTTSTKPLLQSLENHGVENTLVHSRGSTKLVLVGPYTDKDVAREKRDSLKNIRKDAFITKLP